MESKKSPLSLVWYSFVRGFIGFGLELKISLSERFCLFRLNFGTADYLSKSSGIVFVIV